MSSDSAPMGDFASPILIDMGRKCGRLGRFAIFPDALMDDGEGLSLAVLHLVALAGRRRVERQGFTGIGKTQSRQDVHHVHERDPLAEADLITSIRGIDNHRGARDDIVDGFLDIVLHNSNDT